MVAPIGLSGSARSTAPMPSYRPRPVRIDSGASYLTASGAVRVVGYNDMRELMAGWLSSFALDHPDIQFDLDLPGTRFAPAALAAGESAFGPMGGEFTPIQLAGYRRALGPAATPLMIKVAHASLDPEALSGPIAVVVHRDNPVREIALPVLAGVLGGRLTSWDQVPGWGAGSGPRIRPVGVRSESVIGLFVRDRVLGGAALGASVLQLAQSAEVVEAVAEDPLAIGYAAAMRATPDVRILALASDLGSEPVLPTAASITAGCYPLDRHLLVAVRRPVSDLAGEFLALVLSDRGQRVVSAGTAGYLPLRVDEVIGQRTALAAAGFVCN